eukprot:3050997-Amphidinium_carterae.1
MVPEDEEGTLPEEHSSEPHDNRSFGCNVKKIAGLTDLGVDVQWRAKRTPTQQKRLSTLQRGIDAP